VLTIEAEESLIMQREERCKKPFFLKMRKYYPYLLMHLKQGKNKANSSFFSISDANLAKTQKSTKLKAGGVIRCHFKIKAMLRENLFQTV
jgi:hypothetical protein